MGKGKKKGQVQDDWENEMEEIAAEATGIDLTLSEVLIGRIRARKLGRSQAANESVKS